MSSRLLPDTAIFSALTMTTKSPVSMCGANVGLCLPRSSVAACDGEPAEHHVRGIDDVPRARDLAGLRAVRGHGPTSCFSTARKCWLSCGAGAVSGGTAGAALAASAHPPHIEVRGYPPVRRRVTPPPRTARWGRPAHSQANGCARSRPAGSLVRRDHRAAAIRASTRLLVGRRGRPTPAASPGRAAAASPLQVATSGAQERLQVAELGVDRAAAVFRMSCAAPSRAPPKSTLISLMSPAPSVPRRSRRIAGSAARTTSRCCSGLGGA